jgi:ribonuclease J
LDSSDPTSLLAPPRTGTVRFLPLGGVGEIGKNMALLECGADALLLDAGLRFPQPQEVGVDIIVPDVGFVLTRRDRLRAVLLTHGHEDHIGALPFHLAELNVPVYGTGVTLGLLRNKLERRGHRGTADLREVREGQRLRLGEMEVEFLRTTHSVPGSCGLAIWTPAGLVVHTGDFKLDQTPTQGEPPDLERLAQLGREGVLLLLSDSTNAPNSGLTPSEATVRPALEAVMARAEGRVVVVTFASNLARVQQALELAWAAGRRSCLVGRTLLRNFATAQKLGLMPVQSGQMVGPRELARTPDRNLCLIATGSQGEPLAALNRIAAGTHPFLKVHRSDTFVLAANPIPGNGAVVGAIVNRLVAQGAAVLAGSADGVHASGHAAAEELRYVLELLRPRHFVPVHGEPRHLAAHRQLALEAGLDPSRVAVIEDGCAVEADIQRLRLAGWVPPSEVPIAADQRTHPRSAAAQEVVEVVLGPQMKTWVGGPYLTTGGVRVPLRGDHRRWRQHLSGTTGGAGQLASLGRRLSSLAEDEWKSAGGDPNSVVTVVTLAEG